MILRAITRTFTVLSFLARDPGQVRYVPGWLKTLRRSTLDSRLPWLPYRVLERLEAVTTVGSTHIFEYGGGGSTVWFADRGATVTTVEHDEEWFEALSESVGTLDGVSLQFRSSADGYSDYVTAISSEPDHSLDVVIVDGRERMRCFLASISKVKPGGLLILDDTNRSRYRPAFEALDWPNVTYRGLTPSKTLPGVTTVWQRPRQA